MNLFAFSDLHADQQAMQRAVRSAAGADVVVGAGDFADRGLGADILLQELDALTCPIVIVSGNHDRLPELQSFADLRGHVHLLHGTSVTINDRIFLGIGSAIARAEPSPNSEWMHEDDAHKLLSSHTRADVLISHTPPHGVVDIHPDGSSGGSRAVRDAVQRLQPQLCLCGHVHYAHRAQEMLGATRVHNLGPDGALIAPI